MRAASEAALLSVGKESGTEGLLTALPAATLALRAWANVAASGGQAQGTLIGWPFAPFTAPSQLPTPETVFCLIFALLEIKIYTCHRGSCRRSHQGLG